MLRLLGDEARLRILRLLGSEELSVAELQEILGMGQSRISMQLAQLKQAGLIELRRSGQKSLYRLTANAIITELIGRSGQEISEAAQDDRALKLILRKRKDKLRKCFDELAGRFGRHYVPGRSWKGLAEMLLKLVPPMVIADLGAGEGTLSLLLAQGAERVIAVDSSENMVEYGIDVAKRKDADGGVKIGESGVADVNLHEGLSGAIRSERAADDPTEDSTDGPDEPFGTNSDTHDNARKPIASHTRAPL